MKINQLLIDCENAGYAQAVVDQFKKEYPHYDFAVDGTKVMASLAPLWLRDRAKEFLAGAKSQNEGG